MPDKLFSLFTASPFSIAAGILLLCSCTSRKNVVYFQGTSELSTEVSANYYPILQKDDLLSIIVTGQDPEAVAPFNLPPALTMPVSSMGGYTQGAPTAPGYLIDSDGNIDFPVIGKVSLGGLTRPQALALLQEKLEGFVLKPNVNLRILNYKITVLGEVRNPGTFTIPNERITLPEALGIAGDMLISGVRSNVLVIRETNGKITETRVDLRSKEIFQSPVYYLRQNDIVYVEPNKARINSSAVNASNAGIAISVISLLITMVTLLSR